MNMPKPSDLAKWLFRIAAFIRPNQVEPKSKETPNLFI